MVELVVFEDEKEAATIKDLLEANNIKVEVSFFPTWTYLGGARPEAQGKGMIYVEEEQVKKAMAVLEEHEGKEVKMQRMPIPIESPEDKLAWEIKRLRIISGYKNMFWPGVGMIVLGGGLAVRIFLGIADEPLKYGLLVLSFTLVFAGIVFLGLTKQGRGAEKELQIKRKELKNHGHLPK